MQPGALCDQVLSVLRLNQSAQRILLLTYVSAAKFQSQATNLQIESYLFFKKIIRIKIFKLMSQRTVALMV